MRRRIRVYLCNRTVKEIDMSDFSYISDEVFANRNDIVKIVLQKELRK